MSRESKPADRWSQVFSAAFMRGSTVSGGQRQRGRARTRQVAAEWSFEGAPTGPLPYSEDLGLYAPRCVPCHRRFDRTERKPR